MDILQQKQQQRLFRA